MFLQTIHEKPILGGYVARKVHSGILPNVLSIIKMDDKESLLELLDSLNVKYIIFFKRGSPPDWNYEYMKALKMLDNKAIVADAPYYTIYKLSY